MKKQLTLLFLLFLGYNQAMIAQNLLTDFVIVGVVNGDINLEQVRMRYQGQANVYFVNQSSKNGAEQISTILKGKRINDLHIFVRKDNSDLFITSKPVTLQNANSFAYEFKKWSEDVSGKVVIHNCTGELTPELNNLLVKLEAMSDLEFELNQ